MSKTMVPSGLIAVLPCVMILLWIGVIVGWVFFLVAMWKLARAHERLSDHVAQIAAKMDRLSAGTGQILPPGPVR